MPLPSPNLLFLLNKEISNCWSLVTAWQDSRKVSPEPGHRGKLPSSWFESAPFFLLEKVGETREGELMGHREEEGSALSWEILVSFPFGRSDETRRDLACEVGLATQLLPFFLARGWVRG